MKLVSSIILLSGIVLASCSKDNSTGTPAAVAPTNLILNAIVSTDNSGNVSFTASATNAISYDFDFGNGTTQTVVSGIVTYKYAASGTYTVTVVAKNSAGQISKTGVVIVSTTAAPPSGTLVWAEEFNTAGAPDPAKWGYDLGGGGWGNAELENYSNRSDNSIVSGGTLKIILKKETLGGSNYTSARLLTKDKFAFKYGKIEVMAKLPVGGGTWPAIWMLGSNVNTAPWPSCGEMDIMEHLGNDLNKIYGTLHYPGRSGGNANGSTITIGNATTAFHKYALEWSATAIKISVDDVVFHTVANTAGLPFNQDFFIILNVAMGGSFGGAVDPAFISSMMEVDYVRVYQL